MSLLSRIQARSLSAKRSIVPKGFIRRTAEVPEENAEEEAQAIRRAENVEEEKAQTIRKSDQGEEKNEENAQPLRRNEKEEQEDTPAQPLRRNEAPEEEEMAQTVRRTEEHKDDESAQAVRRIEEEKPQEETPENAAPLRRAEKEQVEEEAAQAVRRQAEKLEEEQPNEETAQPSRRPEPNNLSAENSEQPDELSEEVAPPALNALHREVATANTPTAGYSSDHAPVAAVSEPTNTTAAWTGSEQTSTATFTAQNKPQTVQIDQIDVVIQEPASTAASPTAHSNHSRSIRTRYLRRL